MALELGQIGFDAPIFPGEGSVGQRVQDAPGHAVGAPIHHLIQDAVVRPASPARSVGPKPPEAVFGLLEHEGHDPQTDRDDRRAQALGDPHVPLIQVGLGARRYVDADPELLHFAGGDWQAMGALQKLGDNVVGRAAPRCALRPDGDRPDVDPVLPECLPVGADQRAGGDVQWPCVAQSIYREGGGFELSRRAKDTHRRADLGPHRAIVRADPVGDGGHEGDPPALLVFG